MVFGGCSSGDDIQQTPAEILYITADEVDLPSADFLRFYGETSGIGLPGGQASGVSFQIFREYDGNFDMNLVYPITPSDQLNQMLTDFALESINDFVATITNESISFDYILLNAGISQRAPALETDFAVDRKIMETNYFGPVYLIKKLFPIFPVGKQVRIAVTTSISGLFGFPLRSAYCASKHALFGFFESLELENQNIKVTFLIPGRINTPISKSAILGDGSTYAQMDSGQAEGMDVNKCARIALRAILRGKRRKLIGGKELLMVYIKKYIPALFYLLARKISAT